MFFVGALVLLRTDLATRLATTTLRTALTTALGEEVTIGTISVSYIPLEIGLEGVLVADRESGAPIVSAKSIRGRFGFRNWRAGLLRLSVDTPDAHLHLDDDGLREFRDAVKRPSGAPKPSSFPWHELVVTDGHFLVEGKELRLELHDLEVGTEDKGLLDIAFTGVDIVAPGVREQVGPTRFKHVVLTPKLLQLPAIDLRATHVAVDGDLRLDFSGPISSDLSVRAALPGFTTNPSDPRRFVDGVVDADVSIAGLISRPVIEATIASHNVVVWRLSSSNTPIALALGDIIGPLRLEEGRAEIGPLRMPWGEGELSVAGEVELATKAVSLSVLAEGVQLGPILRATGAHAAPWVNFQADLETQVSGSLSPLLLSGPFDLSGSDLVVRTGPYDGKAPVMLDVDRGRLTGQLVVDASHIILDVPDLRFGPSRGRVRGDIGFAAQGPLDLKLHFDALDLEWLQPLGGAGLGGIAKLDGSLSGPFNRLSAEGRLEVRQAQVLNLAVADQLSAKLDSPDLVHLQFTELRADLGRSHYLGEVELAFLPEGLWIDTALVLPDAWVGDLTGIFTDLPGVEGHLSGNVVLSGPPTRLTGEVRTEFDNMEVYGEKFPTGLATAWMDDGILTIGDLVLARRDEAVLVRGSIGRKYAMNLEILSDQMRLEKLDAMTMNPAAVEGLLVADVQIGGTLFDWLPRGRIALERAKVGARPMPGSIATFSTNENGILRFRSSLVGTAATASGSLALRGEQAYDIRAKLDDFPLELLHPLGADGSAITARISGDLDLAGHFGDNPEPVDVDAHFPKVRLTWNQHELKNETDWVVAMHGRSIQVPGLTLTDGGKTRLSFEGWTTGDGRSTFRSGGTIDLDLLRMLAPGISFSEGLGTVDVQIGATGDSPAEIRLTTTDATIRTEWFPRPFNDLSFSAVARADGYRFDDVRAELGGGTFTGGGGIAAVDWRPARYDLQGKLKDTRVQYLDYLPAIEGDADLRFDGPVNNLLLSGRIDIHDMQFRERIDWESKILALQSSRLTDGAREEGSNLFSMDLAVTADESIRLRNNIADADASATLRIIGDTARPGMVGAISLSSGGRMYLQDREFEIARGEIRYLDPYAFDPDLDIQLETDVGGREQDYHVYYGVTGPFSSWRTTTSADPFLSQADINTLLLFGMTREEFEQYGGIAASALAAQATDLVAAQVAANPTQLLDRWSLASGISARGTPTLDSDWRVQAEKELLGFTFIGEIDLGDGNWYAGVERRITKNFFANAYGTSQEEGRALSIATAWGTELKYRWELD